MLDQVIEERPFVLPKEGSSTGQLELAFSANARYLAVFDQQRPRVLWIWELPFFLLKSVLVHCVAIKCEFYCRSNSYRSVTQKGMFITYIWHFSHGM